MHFSRQQHGTRSRPVLKSRRYIDLAVRWCRQVDNIITGSMDGGDTPGGPRDGDTSDARSTTSSESGDGSHAHAYGNGRGFDPSGHGDVAEEPHLDEAERPFRPFSAALMNLHSKEAFMSPAELAAGHDDISPLHQVRPLPQAETLPPSAHQPGHTERTALSDLELCVCHCSQHAECGRSIGTRAGCWNAARRVRRCIRTRHAKHASLDRSRVGPRHTCASEPA